MPILESQAPMTDPTRCLMLLGMHRSYTSLTARWIDACGIDMGKRLLGPGLGNVDGHFEDVDFLELHEAILRDNGLPENGMRRADERKFDPRFSSIVISPERRQQAIGLIAARSRKFGWKEPRTCLFLGFYRDIAPHARSIILYRHFDEVVDSLIRRDKAEHRTRRGWLRHAAAQAAGRFRTHDAYLAAWTHYNRRLLEHAHATGCPVFGDIVTADDAILGHLARWGFSINPVPLDRFMRKPRASAPTGRRFRYDSALLQDAIDCLGELETAASAAKGPSR